MSKSDTSRRAWDIDRFQPSTLARDWMINAIPANEVRMCFVTDDDGHWYLISEGLRELFKTLLEDIRDETSPKWELWQENFEHCRCLPPTSYTFLDPEER